MIKIEIKNWFSLKEYVCTYQKMKFRSKRMLPVTDILAASVLGKFSFIEVGRCLFNILRMRMFTG